MDATYSNKLSYSNVTISEAGQCSSTPELLKEEDSLLCAGGSQVGTHPFIIQLEILKDSFFLIMLVLLRRTSFLDTF